MRDAAWYEGACAGPAYSDLIADLEGDFSAQDIGYLVAIAVKVVIRYRARRRSFLELITLSAVSLLCSLSMADRPGAMFHTNP